MLRPSFPRIEGCEPQKCQDVPEMNGTMSIESCGEVRAREDGRYLYLSNIIVPASGEAAETDPRAGLAIARNSKQGEKKGMAKAERNSITPYQVTSDEYNYTETSREVGPFSFWS